MDANYYIQEPAAASPVDINAQRAAPADVAADVTSTYLTSDGPAGKPATQPPEQYLTNQGYANSAQIAELQYTQGQNVAELFQEDPYSGYAIPPAPPVRAHPVIAGQPMQAALGHMPPVSILTWVPLSNIWFDVRKVLDHQS